jgi:hypothetical protein
LMSAPAKAHLEKFIASSLAAKSFTRKKRKTS